MTGKQKVSWVVELEDREPLMLDEAIDDHTVPTAPMGELLSGLIEQTLQAVPPGSSCEVEIGGKITKTLEGSAGAGVNVWLIQLSLGGKGAASSENNFRMSVKFSK